MSQALEAAFTFTDLHGLGALRREAAQDSPEARRAAAQQFEALFLGFLLQQMRATADVGGGLIDRERMAVPEALFDQQIALTLARGKGTGLAASLLQALGEREAVPPAPPAGAPPMRDAPRPAATSDAAPPAPPTPEAFVAELWPHAARAARELGASPDVLIAQAALETGWGRKAIRGASGEPSFNVFGMKAGSSWAGPKAVVQTVEFEDGVATRRREPFRMYSCLAHSFEDYVRLLKSPRYAGALTADTPERFVRELQHAGYATDPEYADKILSILERGLPGRAAKVSAPAADTSESGVSGRDEPGGGV